MKLLFDQNLSPSLARALQDIFPDSTHVRSVGLRDSPDWSIWNLAMNKGFVIVTKDADFYDRALLAGVTPKILWIRLGNCTTRQAESLIRWRQKQINSFMLDPIDFTLEIP